MKIEHTSIATTTLLTQLLLRLQSDGILSADAIDHVLRESISLNGAADHPANLDASRLLKEVWDTLRAERS